MPTLPAINAGASSIRLPLADTTATALAQALLDRRAGALSPGLVRQMEFDPVMAWWTATTASERFAIRLSTVIEAADWLGEHLVELLSAGLDATAPADTPADQSIWADRVSGAVELAHLAASLARDSGEQPDEAYFAAMLEAVAAWVAAPVAGATASTVHALRSVQRSGSILTGQQPMPAGVDIELCRRQSLQARQQWLAPQPGARDRLLALAAAIARLDRLERGFAEAVEQATLAAMAEFAAGAGHELNNPLAIISLHAQLLLAGEADRERKRDLAAILAQVGRAHEMIADTRLFARPPQIEPETLDLGALVERVLADFQADAAARGIALVLRGRSTGLVVSADPDQLRVALGSAIRNSLEAIDSTGRIEVALSEEPPWTVLRVSDDGPGVPDDVRRQAFNPFYSGRQAGRGLGFGLSKCWRIVTLHGGQLTLTSDPLDGTTLTLRLPAGAMRS